jgi:uncharacterized protein
MSGDALIVFARVPRAGSVKTRLTPALTDHDAAALYEAFLLDALDQFADVQAHVRLYVPDTLSDAEAYFGRDLVIREQAGIGLGPRMQHAIVETFAAGYHRVVIVGTDHPTLPTAFVTMAFEALDKPLSVSIGPTRDGGYYLLGLNDFFPELFDMAFSHGRVFEETLNRASACARQVAILPEWYDVDHPEDLKVLADDLAADATTAPRTRLALSRLGRMAQ